MFQCPFPQIKKTAASSSNSDVGNFGFEHSMCLFDQISPGKYKHTAFNPHGNFDIFAKHLTKENACKKLDKLIKE